MHSIVRIKMYTL